MIKINLINKIRIDKSSQLPKNKSSKSLFFICCLSRLNFRFRCGSDRFTISFAVTPTKERMKEVLLYFKNFSLTPDFIINILLRYYIRHNPIIRNIIFVVFSFSGIHLILSFFMILLFVLIQIGRQCLHYRYLIINESAFL